MTPEVLKSRVEYIEYRLVIGDAQKDQGTPVRFGVRSAAGNEIVTRHWRGNQPGAADVWLGDPTKWGHGDQETWRNDFDDWRQNHGGQSPTLSELQNAVAIVEVGGGDHFNFSLTVVVKVTGYAAPIIANSDTSRGGIASDGEHGWGPTREIRLDLLS